MNLLEQRKGIKLWIKEQIYQRLSSQQIIAKAIQKGPEFHQAVLYELTDPAFTLRPKQEMPEGDWSVWFLRTGRGFGKNHAASAAVNQMARYLYPKQQGLIVAATHKDFWATIFNGPSGLKALARPEFKPVYSERHLEVRWPNGSTAVVRTGDNAQDIRGLSVPWAYADELIKWPKGETSWQNINNCVREGERTRIILTSTPLRGAEWLKKIEEIDTTIVTTGSSRENVAINKTFFHNQKAVLGEGSKAYQEESDGEWVSGDEDLWSRRDIEAITVEANTPLKTFAATMDELLLSIDPGGARDETGIILLGRRGDDYWVLLDASIMGKAAVWFPEVKRIWHEFMRPHDRIIVETNAHRDIDQHLSDYDPSMYVEGIQQTAKAGKATRAEQAQSLYERGLVRHFAPFPKLVQQMVEFYDVLEDRNQSPDRVDALSTGLINLMNVGAFNITPFSVQF